MASFYLSKLLWKPNAEWQILGLGLRHGRPVDFCACQSRPSLQHGHSRARRDNGVHPNKLWVFNMSANPSSWSLSRGVSVRSLTTGLARHDDIKTGATDKVGRVLQAEEHFRPTAGCHGMLKREVISGYIRGGGNLEKLVSETSDKGVGGHGDHPGLCREKHVRHVHDSWHPTLCLQVLWRIKTRAMHGKQELNIQAERSFLGNKARMLQSAVRRRIPA